MEENKIKYNKEIFMSYQYGTPEGYICEPYIYRLMQEAASLQLYEFYEPLEKMKEYGKAYVIFKSDIVFFNRITPYNCINISTWQRASGNVKIYRNYRAECNNQIIAECSTLWTYFDLNDRKPVRASEIKIPVLLCEDDVSASADYKIVCSDTLEFLTEKTVEYSNIDLFGHMNNVVYLDLIYDCLPNHKLAIKHIHIDYLNECKLGEKIKIFINKEDTIYLKGIRSDGKTAFESSVSFF